MKMLWLGELESRGFCVKQGSVGQGGVNHRKDLAERRGVGMMWVLGGGGGSGVEFAG